MVQTTECGALMAVSLCYNISHPFLANKAEPRPRNTALNPSQSCAEVNSELTLSQFYLRLHLIHDPLLYVGDCWWGLECNRVFLLEIKRQSTEHCPVSV